MDILTEAICWFGLGVSTVPVRSRSKVAAVRWLEYTRRLPTPDEIVKWFGRPIFQNYGILTGKRHGRPGHLVVVDFDDLDRGVSWLLGMEAQTYTVATSRGLHAYFFAEEPPPTCHFEGGDLKASGYVLGAGSVHPSGWVYTALTDAPVASIRSIRDVLPDLASPEPQPQSPLRILSKPEPETPWDSAECRRPNLLETIRAKFSVLDFLPGAQKTDLSGRWWVVRCPLHDDRNPSMWVDVERGLCGCYAGCNGGKPLDVVNLAAAIWNVDNRTAIERLRGMM